MNSNKILAHKIKKEHCARDKTLNLAYRKSLIPQTVRHWRVITKAGCRR